MHDTFGLLIWVVPVVYLALQVVIPFSLRGDYRAVSLAPLGIIVFGAGGLFLCAGGSKGGWGILAPILFLSFAIPASTIGLATLWVAYRWKNRKTRSQ